jgi:hypothetical protein
VDPGRFLSQTLTIGSALEGDRFAAIISTEGLTAEVTADRAGTILGGSMTMGAVEVVFERVWAEGEL